MDRLLDIVETVAAQRLSTLVAVLSAAGLNAKLKSVGPYTLFAPTDIAFAKLPSNTVSELLQPENKERLNSVINYHVVQGRVMSDQVIELRSVRTGQGQALRIYADHGVRVNDANMIKADVEASNGVIHVIDSVLLPSATAIM